MLLQIDMFVPSWSCHILSTVAFTVVAVAAHSPNVHVRVHAAAFGSGWFGRHRDAALATRNRSEKKSPESTRTSFGKWCDAVGIKAPRLELGPTADGIPGVTVRRGSRLRPGEVAIAVPFDACLMVNGNDVDMLSPDADAESESSSETSPVPHILDDAAWQDAPSKVRLACRLLDERSKGSASHYDGYINHLPGPYPAEGWERSDTLDRWTDQELCMLQCPALVARTQRRVQIDREWFSRLLSSSSSGHGMTSDHVITFEEFAWALGIVRTRAFSGNFSARTNENRRDTSEERHLVEDDYALLPLIDDLNHRESTHTARRRSTSASAPMPASAAFQYPAVVDVLGRTSTAVCWVAHIAHRPGQEVAHSYLTGSEGLGESFLHEWGFTPGLHDIGAVTVDVEKVSVVIRGDGRIYDEGSVVNKLRRTLGGSGRPAAEDDIWGMISIACDAAEADLIANDQIKGAGQNAASDNGGSSHRTLDPIAPHRRAIAQSFVEGRCKLLRSCAQTCRKRAEGSREIF